MADQYPCPNPACAHVFTLAVLQAAATVRCPRCGFRMQGRGPTAAPAKPAALATAKVVKPILATPLPAKPVIAKAPPVPAAPEVDVDLVAVPPMAPPPVATRPVLPSFNIPTTDTSTTSGRPTRRTAAALRVVMRVAIVLGVLGTACCLVGIAGYYWLPEILGTPGTGGTLLRLSDYEVINGKARNYKGTDEPAFRLLLPKNSWTTDRELRTQLVALGAWVNKEDGVWLAVAVKDFGLQKPREAELVQLAIERLENRYGDGLELAAKTEPIDFVGPPAQKLEFKGRLGAVISHGECIMFSHQGFGYWVFLGGPTLDDIAPFETALRKEDSGLSLVTDRKGWREQPPRTETMTSADGALSVTTPEGAWEKSVPANVEYESGTLLLLGRYLKEKDNQKNAHLQVIKLDGRQGDLKAAMQQTRDYLEKVKKEQNSGYKLTPVEEAGKSELGVVEDVGNRRGRVAEMTLSLNDQPARYYLVAVISQADQTTVVLCDCLWKSRQIWRQEFLGLLKTVRVQAKG